MANPNQFQLNSFPKEKFSIRWNIRWYCKDMC